MHPHRLALHPHPLAMYSAVSLAMGAPSCVFCATRGAMHSPVLVRAVIKGGKGFVTPTETNLHWDTPCFMVKTWTRHKTTEASLNNGWRLVVVGGLWQIAGGGWRWAVGGGQLLAVGGGQRLVVGGRWRWAAAVCGWVGAARQRDQQRNSKCPRRTRCHAAASLWLEAPLGRNPTTNHTMKEGHWRVSAGPVQMQDHRPF